MANRLARTSFSATLLSLALVLVLAITPTLGYAIPKTPLVGTNKQGYGRFYHSNVSQDCYYQNSKYDVVVVVEYDYAAGAGRMLYKRFWVTVYNFSGTMYVQGAWVEDSDGHVQPEHPNDDISTYLGPGPVNKTWYFDIPNTWMHGNSSVFVRTRHGSATEPYCGEFDYLAYTLP